jgi:hypothetical protein
VIAITQCRAPDGHGETTETQLASDPQWLIHFWLPILIVPPLMPVAQSTRAGPMHLQQKHPRQYLRAKHALFDVCRDFAGLDRLSGRGLLSSDFWYARSSNIPLEQT